MNNTIPEKHKKNLIEENKRRTIKYYYVIYQVTADPSTTAADPNPATRVCIYIYIYIYTHICI